MADAGIIEGHASLADLCLLIAVILAAVAAILSFMRKDPEHGVGWAAVGFVALGLLVI